MTEKLSQFLSAPTAPALTDGVPAATYAATPNSSLNYQWTAQQLAETFQAGGIILTILTGFNQFYVSTTGSDVTGDGSIGKPWATTQHAEDFISGNYIFAGATVVVNLGAGSFAGFGMKGILGSGVLQYVGAGSTQTTITGGPSNVPYNFGECLSQYVFSSVPQGIDGVTFNVSALGAGIAGLAFSCPGCQTFLGNELTSSLDIVFSGSAPVAYLVCSAPLQFSVSSIGGGTGITFPGGASCPNALDLANGVQFEDLGTWTVSAGTLTCGDSFIAIASGALYEDFNSGGFSGTVSGPRFDIGGGGRAISTNGPGTLGDSFFPGSSPGFCDQSSSYDGFPVPQETQAGGAPTTSDLPNADSAGWFIDGSGNAYAAMNIAGTIKKVALT